MVTGEVVGCVVSTAKAEGLRNVPLLVVQLMEKGQRTQMIVAADATGQAGQGDFVYLLKAREASRIFRRELVPSDATIVGFIDSYNLSIQHDKETTL